ncbi:HD domain-containing protein [Microbispora sp. H10949]|uniref:HD domain-containing protein n=1 Tax=Microbispora sp. H10949 TaxID=2729111 RepID=UPI0016025E25|nr:HD domain-containing protein [Microbispora sp. H10949]
MGTSPGATPYGPRVARRPGTGGRREGGPMARDDANGTGTPLPPGHAGAADAPALLAVMRELVFPPYLIERSSVVPQHVTRRENDAEHSFALGLAAVCLAPLVDPALDLGRIARYALVHDLPEVHAGDVSVYAGPAEREKKAVREEEAREIIARDFGGTFPWLVEDLDGYRAQRDAESRFVYALDKLLPHVNVLLADHHPLRPTWAAYRRTEITARRKIAASCPALLPLFEELCREFARRPHLFSGGAPLQGSSPPAAGDDDGRQGEQDRPGDGGQHPQVQRERRPEHGGQGDEEGAGRVRGHPEEEPRPRPVHDHGKAHLRRQ